MHTLSLSDKVAQIDLKLIRRLSQPLNKDALYHGYDHTSISYIISISRYQIMFTPGNAGK